MISIMLNVNVRIADANTKQPTPVRLRICDESGKYFPPLGRLEFIPTGLGEDVGGSVKIDHEVWAYSDGVCEVPLPAGVPLRFQVSKGPSWHTIDTTITLGAGQMSVRLEIQRFSEGGHAIDFRAHLIDPVSANLEAAAEGLGVVHVLAKVRPVLGNDGETYPTMPQLLNYSGQTPASARHGCEVYVNTLNTHPVLGQLALIHTHRPIYPLAFGGADGSDDWSLCDWADQAHRKNGLVVWCNPFEETLKNGGEALVALILGKVDAIELSAQPRKVPFLPMLYRLWSAGLHVPLVGSSAKQSNKTVLGAMRTVVEGKDWIESVRTGATYITNEPMLTWLISKNHVDAVLRSPMELDLQLELIVDGQVAKSVKIVERVAREGGASFSFWSDSDAPYVELTTEIPADARWAALRCTSRDGKAFAHTSIISKNDSPRDPKAVAGLLNYLQQTEDWINNETHFANPKRKQQHLDRIAQAREKLSENPLADAAG
jgi:hypothetical protein